jgi:hypothetical protein
MHKNVENFIQEKTLELIKDGFALKIHNTPLVINECGVSSGYFDGDSKSLEVAIKRPQKQWVSIFVHEYSHYTQWKEQCKIWVECDKMWDEVNLWEWLDEEVDYTKSQLRRMKISTQKLEQDCDKRAVKLIDQYNLPIDKEEYIQASNAYILFYNIVVEKRKWYSSSPYSDKRIHQMMPTEFIPRKEYEKVPPKFKKLIVNEFLD